MKNKNKGHLSITEHRSFVLGHGTSGISQNLMRCILLASYLCTVGNFRFETEMLS